MPNSNWHLQPWLPLLETWMLPWKGYCRIAPWFKIVGGKYAWSEHDSFWCLLFLPRNPLHPPLPKWKNKKRKKKGKIFLIVTRFCCFFFGFHWLLSFSSPSYLLGQLHIVFFVPRLTLNCSLFLVRCKGSSVVKGL